MGKAVVLTPQLAIDGPSNGGPIASPPFPDQRPVLAEHWILRRRRIQCSARTGRWSGNGGEAIGPPFDGPSIASWGVKTTAFPMSALGHKQTAHIWAMIAETRCIRAGSPR